MEKVSYDWLHEVTVGNQAGKIRFHANLADLVPAVFGHYPSGYMIENILRNAGVLRKNQGTTDIGGLWVHFSNMIAGQNFIDRLNKYIGEQVEDQKSEGPTVTRADRFHAGSCNFCSSRHRLVWVISGHQIQMRLCNDCFVKVRQQINLLSGR